MPGDAPCADASITAPTDDSTDALHTAAADVPEGILNDSVDVSTTVVGGMDETEGLSEGVTEGDTLDVTVTLADDDDDKDDAGLLLTELLHEGEAATDALSLGEADTEEVAVGDTLLITLGDTDDEELTDDDALTLDDTLDDGDVE